MLTENERAQWRELGCAPISDAMELMSIRRAVIPALRCLSPDTVVGTACTVRQIPKHASADKFDRLVRHAEVSKQLARPGQIVVMDAGGEGFASWGEQHSRRCVERGVAGLVIHGCVRDAAKIRRLGFPVFCRGFSPVKSQWDLETAAIDEPIAIGDVQIRPGDLIVADEDGIVVVPWSRRLEIMEAAQRIVAEEGLSRPAS